MERLRETPPGLCTSAVENSVDGYEYRACMRLLTWFILSTVFLGKSRVKWTLKVAARCIHMCTTRGITHRAYRTRGLAVKFFSTVRRVAFHPLITLRLLRFHPPPFARVNPGVTSPPQVSEIHLWGANHGERVRSGGTAHAAVAPRRRVHRPRSSSSLRRSLGLSRLRGRRLGGLLGTIGSTVNQVTDTVDGVVGTVVSPTVEHVTETVAPVTQVVTDVAPAPWPRS